MSLVLTMAMASVAPSTSTSQFNCISTQDKNAIRPSIHADCIGVLGSGVGAQRVTADAEMVTNPPSRLGGLVTISASAVTL